MCVLQLQRYVSLSDLLSHLVHDAHDLHGLRMAPRRRLLQFASHAPIDLDGLVDESLRVEQIEGTRVVAQGQLAARVERDDLLLAVAAGLRTERQTKKGEQRQESELPARHTTTALHLCLRCPRVD